MKVPPKDTLLKNALFGLVLVLLLLPWLEQNEHFFQPRALGGVPPSSENVQFSLDKWRSVKFQEGQEAYIKDHFGLRPFMVRFYNELFDRLFDEYQAKGVVMGKDGYLFEENYLLAASGQDYLGIDSITKVVSELNLIKQDLAKHGKHLLVCLAPGKGSYFPDKMPSRYQFEKQLRNHPYFSKTLQDAQIPVFDIQSWFLQMKATTPHPLYPKTGIHWSSYGEYLVADSLIKRLAHLSQKPFPYLKLSHIEEDTQPRDRDDDIENGMNLLRNLPDFKMAYPQFKVQRLRAGQKPPRVLVIGDSFYYGMYNWGMMQRVFKGGEFWYYNQERLVPDQATSSIADMQNYVLEVNKFDVVVLLLTEANLTRFGFGMQQMYLGKIK